MSEEIEVSGTKWRVASYGIEYFNGEEWESIYDYEELIKLLNPDTDWLFEQDSDYQGEYFAVGKSKDGKYLFIQGSFGSCSGCDWMQGISDLQDLKRLLNYHTIEAIIKNSKEEMITYMAQTLQNVSWSRDILAKLIAKFSTYEQIKTTEEKTQ